jgi:hypothetical protein
MQIIFAKFLQIELEFSVYFFPFFNPGVTNAAADVFQKFKLYNTVMQWILY